MEDIMWGPAYLDYVGPPPPHTLRWDDLVSQRLWKLFVHASDL